MITMASFYASRPDHPLFTDGSQHDGVASSVRSQRIGNSSRPARPDELVQGAGPPQGLSGGGTWRGCSGWAPSTFG
jgi:hypothetical protein